MAAAGAAYGDPVDLPSVRMTANLNALVHQRVDLAPAVRAMVGADVAHHVLDPDGLLELDPLAATDLSSAVVVLLAAERQGWFLGLPTPGSLPPLRGPRELNEAALQAGEVVLAGSAGIALVPLRVGRAVQWRLHRAERPLAPVSPYEAERALNEAVLGAARTLLALDVAAGHRPLDAASVPLAPGYSPRQVATANRTLYLRTACEAALRDDGASLSSFEADVRLRTLRSLRAAASDALCASCSWPEDGQRG